MRIEQLRFANLNSLVGEWSIDFTCPEYLNDGIFAITGPTGAGKSTLLDAICLALYGRTPRLGKLSKSENEILARQTGDCFAEVTFSTLSGRFRCYWGQHRSRRKADGELQQPRHELVNADTGVVMENRIKDVEQRVPEITGMDFERFTRSMLLAQGGFAAFLKSSADERAPILEQITGTAIYSQISMHVHEVRGRERKKLDEFELGLQGMALLSPQQEQQLRDDIAHQEMQVQLAQQQADKGRHCLEWRKALTTTETSLSNLSVLQKQLQARIDAFAPRQQTLDRARQASALVAEYSQLRSLRQRQTELQVAISECHQQLPQQEARHRDSVEALQQQQLRLDAVRDEWQRLQPELRLARQLDQQIREHQQHFQGLEDQQSLDGHALQALRERQQQLLERRSQSQQQLEQIQQWMEANAVAEQLREGLTGIEQQGLVIQRQQKRILQQRADVVMLDEQCDQVQGNWRQLRLLNDRDTTELDQVKEQLAQLVEFQHRQLDGQTSLFWRNSLQQQLQYQARLQRLAELVAQLHEEECQSEAAQNKSAMLAGQHKSLAERLDLVGTRVETLQMRMEALRMTLSLKQTMRSLEDHRHKLVDGQACPLCGALDHPFALGNVPVPSVNERDLEEVRIQHATAIQDETALRVALGSLQREQQLVVESSGLLVARIHDLHERAALVIRDLGMNTTPDDCGLPPLLTSQLQAVERDLAAIDSRIQMAEEVELKRQRLQAAMDDARERMVLNQSQFQQLSAQLESLQLQLEAQRGHLAEEEQLLVSLLADWAQWVTEFGLAADIEPAAMLVVLRERQQQWGQQSERRLELQQALGVMESEASLLAGQTSEREHVWCVRARQITERLQQLESLRVQRQKMLGGRQADDAESAVLQRLEGSGKDVEVASAALREQELALGHLHAALTRLHQDLGRVQEQITGSESAWQPSLEAAGFESEGEFELALLDGDALARLQADADALRSDQVRQEQQWQALTAQQSQLAEQALTEDSEAVLQQDLYRYLEAVESSQQQLGALRQQWRTNQALLQQQQERLVLAGQQRALFERWDALHQLIGSADGKKYRNFAQGLTFDILIGHANQQLQKMTDRYLLVRNRTVALDLDVMDNWQAGEVRSTRNLSGGEGFLISLALALGLSQMASRQVRVDSLFLDEGFGTLDDEALEVALDTLSGLHSEGKLIGVISHVAALKERIGTRIEVVPVRGGRSRLSGPGCEAIG